MSSRVGLIVPSSNTVAEVDFYTRLPAKCTLHTARMHLVRTTPEAEAEMLDDHLPKAVSDLETARPDVIVFGCTSAGVLCGNSYEAELIATITAETGAKTISVASAVRRWIVACAPRRIGVLTPYVDSLNHKIRESLEADGLEVAGVHGLGIRDNFAIADVEPDRIAQFAADCFSGGDVDLLFASCTNFRAFDARERIQERLGIPVVTSNHAALVNVLHWIGGSSGA